MQFSRYDKFWPGGSVGQSAALSRRRSTVQVRFGSLGLIQTVWDLSSAGRASALQAEGHRFEPCRSHFFYKAYGGIAQLARAHGSYPWCREFKSPFRYFKTLGFGVFFIFMILERMSQDNLLIQLIYPAYCIALSKNSSHTKMYDCYVINGI